MNKTDLVFELFSPDENGISRWVSKEECVGKYESLYFNNGNPWYRNKGLSHLKFEKKTIDKVDHWRFNGLIEVNTDRPIRKDIREVITKLPCAHTGFKDTKNNKIIVDHKNGRYDDDKVKSKETQTIEDFQPLCNQANLQKRTHCGNCVKTNNRFDAKELGYIKSTYEGSLKYEGTCIGCYWYDCLKFKSSIKSLE